MAVTQSKDIRERDGKKTKEKRTRLEPAPEHVKAPADESIPFAGPSGVSAMDPPFKSHVALLGDPRFSHPANNAEKAGLVTELQQAYGNRYVQRLLESLNVQAKLIVNPPDDQYEREADRVADAVTIASAPSIQRQAEPEEPGEEEKEEEEPIQTKLTNDIQVQRQAEELKEEEEEEASIQPKLTNNIQVRRQLEASKEEGQGEPSQTEEAGGQTPSVRSGLKSRIDSLKGGGQPLAESTRRYFEPRFGSSFSNVRIHNNPQAANIANSINAKAFTKGNDIVFGAGQYSPETPEGGRLLAHELTHVVQQDLSTARGNKISKANEPAEVEAQRVGEAILCDRPLLPIKASAAQISRQESGAREETRAISPTGRLLPRGLKYAPGTRYVKVSYHPPSYSPPPEVYKGKMPGKFEILSLDTQPLYNAIMKAKWPKNIRAAVGWEAWTDIKTLASLSYWQGNMANACTGGGREMSWTYGMHLVDFEASVQINARISSTTFQRADGIPVSGTATGGGTLKRRGKTSESLTTGVKGGSKAAEAGAKATTTTERSSEGVQVGKTTVGSTEPSALFKFNVTWSVTIRQGKKSTVAGAFLGVVASRAALALQKVFPIQRRVVKSHGVIRFPLSLCKRLPATNIRIAPSEL